MTQPRMAEEIAARTRREYPDGIPAYGTDALRFTFCAMASQGRDLAFDLKRIEGYRNFCNKLWNATKFVLGHVGDKADLDGDATLSQADRWIRSRTRQLATTAHRALADYRFDLYANAVYEFAWHEYCDWYLELTKPVLFDAVARPAEARAAKRTLLAVLDMLLRTAHPIVPFITETLWRRIAPLTGASGDADTIMRRPFPDADDAPHEPDAQAAIEWLKGAVTAIRNIRGELKVPPGTEVALLLQGGTATDRRRLDETRSLLARLAKVGDVRWLDDTEEPPPVSVQLIGGQADDDEAGEPLKVMVPMEGLIDVDAERRRLGKEVDKLGNELRRAEGKLANANFVAKAPPPVVAKERQRALTLARELKALEEQRAKLATLETAQTSEAT